ncbi:hypothetical protein JCM14036_27320 [Desulfotomaculum defluvii]
MSNRLNVQADNFIRLTNIDEMGQYLKNVEDGELHFRVFPISGTPEEFHYNGHQKSIIRKKDQKLFDNVEDFICYTFQCDQEGYANTEYVDLEVLK